MKNVRNFYYRLICACLVLAVIGSNTLVFASSPDDIHSQENNFCQELSGIPIFFDFVAPINSDSKQSSLSLSDSNEIYTDTEAIVNEQLEICESMQLSTTERQIVYAQSPFYQTLERAEKIIADGGLVKGIHFLFPIAENGSDLSVSTILSSNDWRDYTMPLRTYNGYEFRYLDSYVDGETGYINVDDIGTVEWRKVVSSGLKALFPTVVSAAGAPVAGNALGVSITLSDTISPLSVRPNLTYSYSAVSYVKYNAIYRNYMRSFYISDKDNLICLLRYLPHYYNGGTAAIWQTAGKLFQKKNAMNHLFIAFLIPYSIFSLVVRPCVQQRLRGCCEDFDFSVRQLIQQRFKLHPLRGLALHSFTMKNLIHRDMIAGHQF